jgi:hypothetical protein
MKQDQGEPTVKFKKKTVPREGNSTNRLLNLKDPKIYGKKT